MGTWPRSRRPARSSTICGARRRSTSRTCAPSPTDRVPTRCSSIRPRSSIWRSSRARTADRAGLAAGRDRSHGDLDRQPPAAVVAAPAAGHARADPRSARRRRRARVSHDRPRQVSRRDQGRAGSRAAARAGRAGHGRPSRSGGTPAVGHGHSPRPRGAVRTCGRRWSSRCSPSSTTSPDIRDDIERDPGRRTSRAGARGRLHARRPRSRRSTSSGGISRSGKQVIAEMENASAPDRDFAQGPLQPGVRLLHRGLEVEPARRAAGLPPQADDRRRRRFITPALKEYEEKVLGATSGSSSARSKCSTDAAQRGGEAPRMKSSARPLAPLDVLAGFAEIAAVNDYIKRHMHDWRELPCRRTSSGGRTASAGRSDAFIPNDIALDAGRQLVILTGPNMGGKSTYLRQVACCASWRRPARSCPPVKPRSGSSIGSSRASARRTTSPGAVHVHGRDAGNREHPQQGHRGA